MTAISDARALAERLDQQADASDQEANRYGDRGGDPRSPSLRRDAQIIRSLIAEHEHVLAHPLLATVDRNASMAIEVEEPAPRNDEIAKMFPSAALSRPIESTPSAPTEEERRVLARAGRLMAAHEPWWSSGACKCGARLGDRIDWDCHLANQAILFALREGRTSPQGGAQ